MCEISIVMPAYNAEQYICKAIDSILCQSFTDFECLIIDDGSTDSTRDIIRSYDDERIVLIENKHDFIGSLNLGLETARGKYIARMDADDMMHVDRMKIQYTIMEEYPDIVICGTWMNNFGLNLQANNIVGTVSGLIENPILKFMKGNFLYHPTVMIRTAFLREHALKYEKYLYAEDFKLWTEVAKLSGQFYIENQPLLYYRISDNQVSNKNSKEQKTTTEIIITEITEYLIEQNKQEYPELFEVYNSFCELKEKQLFTKYEISAFFQNLFSKNEKMLNL
ncbi:glycosyltransferase [Bacteroides pyogenes]|jgi:glycosyltransferase involved in cell wall biosynthesis|uniref:glycosyltransferase family 2 protein n=2 Tax=Bacteroides pyogenes TaxID=310300 RepID=UPI0011E40513|nr:glycosyltransferase family 2 protein [Bacteroides pyogenes]MBR8709557.1 hypothetical protein [Bacteroides pyogenes]MBR8718407.1 hypothetical protein [Bacteroides pyogenes]MBR8747881.1 hypothetical protein [Bacteroides pyogenes]MBR8758187.1 hypothetical protein [Bacteroides pyogenes]MBR8781428.1 hypothetical protein [Bacteroides pyogenes]